MLSEMDNVTPEIQCGMCKEPATGMSDFLGLYHIPGFNGGYLPSCELCDKISDLFYDIKFYVPSIEEDGPKYGIGGSNV